MIVVAIAMSGYAWWHQFQSGRQSAEFWGPAEAVLVRYAPRVEFLVLRENGDEPAGETLTVLGTQEYEADEPIEVTGWRGMVHARHALVDDLSYDWNAPIPANAKWEFLLRFRDRDRLVTVAFAPEQGLICFVDRSRVNSFIPKIADAFRQKRDEWLKLAAQRP
jgi:hypothetical protein